MLRICCLAALLLLPFAGLFAGPEKRRNYYPLDVLNQWHYRVTENAKKSTLTTRVGKFEDFKGVKCARLESPNLDRWEYLTQTDQGVFRHGANNDAIVPPFKLLPYPPTPGAKWEGTFTIGKEPGKHKYSGEVLDEVTIDLDKPLGKVKALRSVIKLESAGKIIETTYWFAHDLGIVKQSFETGGLAVVLELEKFEKK
jgi:hypothetical protein